MREFFAEFNADIQLNTQFQLQKNSELGLNNNNFLLRRTQSNAKLLHIHNTRPPRCT